MLQRIVKTAKEKGMIASMHFAWYVMSILNIKQGKFDIAYGILNNADIQMEKNSKISEYLIMLNKFNMYKVLMCCGEKDKAEICKNQAAYIAQKYDLNFNLNIDINKLMSDNQNIEPVKLTHKNNAVENGSNTERVSERENIQESGFNAEDSDMVNPEDFFS